MKNAVKFRKIINISVLIFSIIITAPLSASCGVQENKNYLLYQQYPFEIDGTLETGDKEFQIHISAASADDISVWFTEKEKIHGSGFRFTDTDTELIFGDTAVKLPDSAYGSGILAIPELFKLRDEQLADVKVKNSENFAEFVTDNGRITVVVLTDGTLKRMEGKINGTNIVLNVWKITFQNK